VDALRANSRGLSADDLAAVEAQVSAPA